MLANEISVDVGSKMPELRVVWFYLRQLWSPRAMSVLMSDSFFWTNCGKKQVGEGVIAGREQWIERKCRRVNRVRGCEGKQRTRQTVNMEFLGTIEVRGNGSST